MLRWLIDIAKTFGDAVHKAVTGMRFAPGLALIAILVHPFTVLTVLTAVSITGVVIPIAAGATIAEHRAAEPGRFISICKEPISLASTGVKVRSLIKTSIFKLADTSQLPSSRFAVSNKHGCVKACKGLLKIVADR